MSEFLRVFQVFEKLFEARYRRRYDTRLQLMAYQIKMLRDRIGDERIYTKPEERAELMRLGALLDHDVSDVMLVVKPGTYRGWLKPKETKPRRPGRPGTAKATADLVLRFALENLGWGYKRLHGELKKLGIRIGLTTIYDILKREDIHPVPDKERGRLPSNWKLFLSSHMDTLVATDFFTKPVLTWKGTKIIKTPVRTPVANSFIECNIGKAKRECLNHFFCVSLDQLNYINREWLAYYNNERPHQGEDIGNKVLRPGFKPTDKGEIKRDQRLGGVISWYYREAA